MLPVRVAALDGPGEEGHGSVVSNKYRYGSASGPIATPSKMYFNSGPGQ